MFCWIKRLKINRLLNRLKKCRYLREQGDKKARIAEIQLLYQLAEFYRSLIGHKKFPQAKVCLFEYYRAAAGLNDAKAQYFCALSCFEIGRFYEAWHRSDYGREIHELYMKEGYQQAFNFLDAAEANRYVEAKRYKGIVYINGWGVPKDTAKGFNLILESIEMENAWPKATKIVEKLGLNSKDFFQALTQYKSKAVEAPAKESQVK